VSPYELAGLGLGVVLIAAYLLRSRGAARLERAIMLVLAAGGITTGIKLVLVCATADDLAPFERQDRVYIFVGGITLAWVSVQTIGGVLRDAREGDS